MGKRGPKKGDGGRPKFKITDEQLRILDNVAALLASQSEIAVAMGISRSTFQTLLKEDENLLSRYKNAQDEGRSRLRRAQWKNALAGDRVMQIWLGKQYLGQKDKHDVTQETHAVEDKIVVLDDYSELTTDEIKERRQLIASRIGERKS